MAWPTNDTLKAALVNAGYPQDINTALVYFLRDALSTTYGSLNDLLFAYLAGLGYAGSLNDKIDQWDGSLTSAAITIITESGVYQNISSSLLTESGIIQV